MLADRYRPGPDAGKWPYGSVCLAADELTRKTVLLKTVAPELHGGSKGLSEFSSWAVSMREVKHAALPALEDVLQSEGRVVLVTERLEGQPLSTFLGEGRRISIASALVFLCQIAAGLDHAHSRGQVHGDLTPRNILITGKGRAKLLDLGLGQALRKAAGTLPGATMTAQPLYMAPEQESGPAVPASDLYTLAIIFCEMTTGRFPFVASEHWSQKRSMAYPAPSFIAPELPPDLDPVLAKALRPEPQERYADCAQFIAALDRLTG
jgi:serine/threonine-protein kinase